MYLSIQNSRKWVNHHTVTLLHHVGVDEHVLQRKRCLPVEVYGVNCQKVCINCVLAVVFQGVSRGEFSVRL